MVVLGISVGAQKTGIAIINDKELVIWEIIKVNTITQRHERVLTRYVTQFGVSVVVIKAPPETHVTHRLRELMQAIRRLCEQFGCAVHWKTDKHIKQITPEIINKRDIIEFTSNHYPDLLPEKERSNNTDYYIKLFEAVLVAHQFLLSDSPPF